MTDSSEWKRTRAALEEALDLEGEQRAAFLHRLRVADAALAQSVQALLERDGESEVDDTPRLSVWEDLLSSATLPMGTRVGSYEIRSVIASGGMGTVYKAERADDVFRKSVAIKLIKRGMDSAVILERFRHERQVLADLDHPGIARLLDGGMSEDGQPYFVMEFIDGEPIDEWCDAQSLSIRERLELFQRVCHGVHHAHQRLIVHRDLKPSNILVTAEGEPKLLDFGVARMLDPQETAEAGVWTRDQGFLGTPSFASPEQLRGERVTTATDIYSLGVVLYRLLAGRGPYELSQLSREEARRRVCDVEPTRPSRLLVKESVVGAPATSRQLRGDLDNIVMLALRKEPDRRYASAEQFAEDVQRHLDGLPVRARANTLGYRCSKFVGRNRAASLIGTVLLVSLLIGTVAITKLYFQATEANEEAGERIDDFRRLASAFIFDVSGDMGPFEGTVEARERIVRYGLEQLSRLEEESRGDSRVVGDLGNAYLRLGDLQGGRITSNLGRRDEARASYEKARSLALDLLGVDEDSPRVRVLLANSLFRIADLDHLSGDLERTFANLAEALTLCPADSELAEVRRCRANVLSRLGERRIENGEPALATPFLEESVEIQEGLLEADPQAFRLRRDLAVSYHQLSSARLFAGESEDALALCREACAQLEELLELEESDGEIRQLNVAFQIGLGRTCFQLELYEEALEPLQLAEEAARSLLAADANNELVLRNLGTCLQVLGTVYSRLERVEEALDTLLEALRVSEELMRIDSTGLHARRMQAVNCSTIAGVLIKLGRLEEAHEYNERSLSEFEVILERNPGRVEARRDLVSCFTNLGAYHMSGAKDAQRSKAECRRHAELAESRFQQALDSLGVLEKAGQLAPSEREYVGLLERFVEDARALRTELEPTESERVP